MTRSKLFMLGLGMALVAVFATPALAQDGPAITVEPTSVDAAGEATFTVSGTGWTAAPPIFVLPCPVPESGDITELSADQCDTTNLTPAVPEDGAFTVEVTYDVPEEGIVVAAGDAAQSEAAAALITVGAAEEEAPAEEAEEEAPAEEEEAPAEEEEAPTEDAELAQTGSESTLITVVGITIVLLGAMVLATGRRFTTS